MSVFVNREGNISVFRVGIFLLIVGVIVAIGGYVLFNLEQNRFNSPLNVDLYPEAVEMGVDTVTNTQRIVIYRVEGASVEDVRAFYDREIADFYDANPDDPASLRPNDQRCNRHPLQGIYEDYVEGSGTVQYYFSCMFNDSQYNNNRWTEVRIMPGLLHEVDGVAVEDTRGQARIEYHQWWQ